VRSTRGSSVNAVRDLQRCAPAAGLSPPAVQQGSSESTRPKASASTRRHPTLSSHVLEGVAEISIGGLLHRLGKDEMIVIPAKVFHALKAVERFKMMLVMSREATD
jgi:quercetin dioxygenase-like cupin family protein